MTPKSKIENRVIFEEKRNTMELVFGGAYQGKLDYALKKIKETKGEATGKTNQTGKADNTSKMLETEPLVYSCPDIQSCDTPEGCIAALDLAGAIKRAGANAHQSHEATSPLIIDHLERMVYAFIDAGRDPVAYIKENPEIYTGRIVIIEDISQGVVPIDTKERAWREANGRVMAYLAGEAETVTRVFCGIPQRLK